MDAEKEAIAAHGADILVTWRPMYQNGYEYVKMFSDLSPKYKDGLVLLPPLLVLDSDDAIDYVHPFNFAYAALGVRGFDSKPLTPGQNVVWKNADGKETVLWKDKVSVGQSGMVFDIERNLKDMGYHYDAARVAGGVTVTCEELRQNYIDQGVNPDKVYVYPNSLIPSDFPHIDLAPHKDIRIVWEGGASHMDSWWEIHEPLEEVLKENPNVKLVVLGQDYPSMRRNIDKAQIEFHPWVDYAAYKIKRATLGGDINLCPLVDQVFTRCKSAIRWYEGSIGKYPEASLAANVGPYKEIEDGETGLLYDDRSEFKTKLETLIKEKELRHKLGKNAKKWVMTNRTPKATVPGLAAFYKELKSRQRKEALVP
jgi:glycosyltransferase involved in cell wall biosynthesis